MRKWLAEFLPKKYAVTSGFIIPEKRSMNYLLYHYDVIIYDVLNAPVLWGNDNSDNSEQGRTRAIPAKYVHAVLEVKSSLTKEAIKDATAKLQELVTIKEFLSKNFVSGSVFYEIRTDNQASCKVAEGLFIEGVPGYFGGIVLRAEGIDPNVSAYFRSLPTNEETNADMPLVHEIDQSGRHEGGIIISRYMEGVTAVMFDDVWNFDRFYAPPIKNVHMLWSYNSFAGFLIDFLARLEGEEVRIDKPRQHTFGMSFTR